MCVTLLAVVGLSACSPAALGVNRGEAIRDLAPFASYEEIEISAPVPLRSLAGRSDFDVADLDPEVRLWHERLRSAVDASREAMVFRARRDDTYDMGRWLFQYHAALLLGLRVTGDLRYLDEVDVVAEAMREQLEDGWCGDVARSVDVNVRYGTVREPDGFRNFRLRAEPGRDYCRDTGDLNEALVHGHLAMVMYAYHANRHLQSPSDVDYGERADFWLAYLRDDFEAKWRRRSGTQWPDMDFMSLKFCHTYSQMLLYYHFVGLRLLEDGSADAAPYLRQAARLTDGLYDVPYVPGRRPGGFIDVETPLGSAVVYSFGAPGDDDVTDVHLEACPVTYARYMLTSAMVLHLENVPGWSDDLFRRIATGLAYYVVDTEPLDARRLPFAAGVSGDRRVAGMPATTYRSRTSIGDYSRAPFAAYAAWDASGTLDRVSLEVYESSERNPNRPEQVFIPAGRLLAAFIGPSIDRAIDGARP